MIDAVFIAIIIAFILFFLGILPIPVGWERGKIKWIMWCGTGMHPHIVYRDPEYGFQTLHPDDKGGDA